MERWKEFYPATYLKNKNKTIIALSAYRNEQSFTKLSVKLQSAKSMSWNHAMVYLFNSGFFTCTHTTILSQPLGLSRSLLSFSWISDRAFHFTSYLFLWTGDAVDWTGDFLRRNTRANSQRFKLRCSNLYFKKSNTSNNHYGSNITKPKIAMLGVKLLSTFSAILRRVIHFNVIRTADIVPSIILEGASAVQWWRDWQRKPKQVLSISAMRLFGFKGCPSV